MKSFAHLRVAALAAGVMPAGLRSVIQQLWDGIETGTTLTDEFLWFWDTDDHKGTISQILMHRCYMDSDSPNDRGCPLQIVRYARGIPGFFEEYAAGGLHDYEEESFMVNAGAYLGVVSHHVADLHTPVHVGCRLPMSTVGYKTRQGFHSRVEADLDYTARTVASIKPYVPSSIVLSDEAFLAVAQRMYEEFYLKLPTVYGPPTSRDVRTQFFQDCVSCAAKVTADVWTTVFAMLSPRAAALLGG